VGQVLQAAGHRVHQFGRHKSKLRIAEKAVSPPRSPEPPADRGLRLGRGGYRSAAALRQAVQMARPRGTVFMKSTVHGDVPIDTAPIIVHEITLVAPLRPIRAGPQSTCFREGSCDRDGSERKPYPGSSAFELAARHGF